MKTWKLPAAPDHAERSEHFIGLLSRQEDFECVLLASMGLSDDAIAAHTRLSLNQVRYRLRSARDVLAKSNMTRRAYRAGTSPIAGQVMRSAAVHAAKPITARLRLLEA